MGTLKDLKGHRRQKFAEWVEAQPSQAVVADRLEVTRSYLNQLVRGKRPITDATAKMINEKLGMPGWLDGPDELGDPHPASIETQLLRTFRVLPAEAKLRVLVFIMSLHVTAPVKDGYPAATVFEADVTERGVTAGRTRESSKRRRRASAK